LEAKRRGKERLASPASALSTQQRGESWH
jgi:hypothetical protein